MGVVLPKEFVPLQHKRLPESAVQKAPSQKKDTSIRVATAKPSNTSLSLFILFVKDQVEQDIKLSIF